MPLSPVDAFQEQFRRDAASGSCRPLSDYLTRFPGDDVGVARAFVAASSAASASASFPAFGVTGGSFGAYRIVREIGRGGQGTVYLAQDSRLDRPIALKVLRQRSVEAPALVERFQREATLLSRLNHSGICTVYEAGVESGVPYIAMEYVDGVTLGSRIEATVQATQRASAPSEDGEETDTLRWEAECAAPTSDAAETVDVPRVLALVESVARALHAAHEAGILHRDVKPSNIMTTPVGRAVIMDFGLARQEDEQGPNLTEAGEVFGTPAYMSPEQLGVLGIQVDRRTDIWSLGVTLYECLTLRRPFHAPSREALFHQIQTAEPPDPRRYNRRLSSDVAIVLATALEKVRGRRYQTALDFAEDLRRIREFQPIQARPVPRWVRVRRWSQRHPGVALSLSVALLSLTVGLAVSLRLLGETRSERDAKDRALAEEQRIALAESQQRRLAEARFRDVHELSLWFITKFDEELADLRGAVGPRRLLVEKGLLYLDRLQEQASADTALLHSIALAYEKIGEVQGCDFRQNLGQHREALQSLEKARTLLRRVRELEPNPECDRLHHRIGAKMAAVAYEGGDRLLAQQLLDESREFLDRQVSAGEPSEALRLDRANLLLQEALVREQEGAGGLASVLRLVEEAVTILEPLKSQPRLADEVQRSLMVAHFRRGDAYGNPFKSNLGRWDDAIADYRAGLAICELLYAAAPQSVSAARDVVIGRHKLGLVLRRTRRLDEALDQLSLASAVADELVRSDPQDGRSVADAAVITEGLADVRADRGDIAGASKDYDRALRLLEQLARQSGEPGRFVGRLATLCERHGRVLIRSGELERGKAQYRQARGHWSLRDLPAHLAPYRHSTLVNHGLRFAKLMEEVGDSAGLLEARSMIADTFRERLIENPADPSAAGQLAAALIDWNIVALRHEREQPTEGDAHRRYLDAMGARCAEGLSALSAAGDPDGDARAALLDMQMRLGATAPH